jgi:hypothetical protein
VCLSPPVTSPPSSPERILTGEPCLDANNGLRCRCGCSRFQSSRISVAAQVCGGTNAAAELPKPRRGGSTGRPLRDFELLEFVHLTEISSDDYRPLTSALSDLLQFEHPLVHGVKRSATCRLACPLSRCSCLVEVIVDPLLVE